MSTVKCRTCRRHKKRKSFPYATSKRCTACWKKVHAAAVCRHCGEPSGLDKRGNPRAYCDRPDCQFEKHAATTRGRKKPPMPASRPCAACGKRKPLDEEHFSPVVRDPDGRVLRFHSYCRPCNSADQRLRYRDDPARKAAARARAAEQRDRINERRATDPAFDALWRARIAEQSRTKRRRLREGGVLKLTPVDREQMGYLSAAPLVAAVDAWLAGREEHHAEAFIAARNLFDWRAGRVEFVKFDVADRVLIGIDKFWWEVWEPGVEGYERAAELFAGERVAA